MSGSAMIMMIVGITVIWGGLIASIWHAVKTSREETPPKCNLKDR